MKDAYYFSHDCGARNDPKILQLRLAMGWEGFGIYFAVIEILREQRGYKFPSLAKASLCLTLSIEKTTLEKFFGLALDLGLLVDDGDSIYSESLLRRMEKKEELKKKLSEAGRKGGLAKASLKPPPTIKGKERKGKERKGKSLLHRHLLRLKATFLKTVIWSRQAKTHFTIILKMIGMMYMAMKLRTGK